VGCHSLAVVILHVYRIYLETKESTVDGPPANTDLPSKRRALQPVHKYSISPSHTVQLYH